MNLILFIVLFLFFYKVCPICLKEGDKYFKEHSKYSYSVNIPIKKQKAVKVSMPKMFKGLMKSNGSYRDSFDVLDNMTGSFDIYVDKNGFNYAQGIVQGRNAYLISEPSVIFADIEHMGERIWYDDYGRYEAIESNFNGEIKPLANYFLYYPQKCPICGAPVEYEPQTYPLGIGKEHMYLAVPRDSHDRYCSHCNEILQHNTETYYPFYIDTIKKKIITSQNKKQFAQYMQDCVNIRNINRWISNTPESDLDWVSFDETLLTKGNLSEYTKNADIAPMWERLKVLK